MSSLWSRFTAAPHRVMFLPGAIQGVATMLWWMVALSGGSGAHPMPAGLMHGWQMLYGFFPFFVLGFLFTAMPNWLNGPAIARRDYLLAGAGMTLGVVAVYAGAVAVGLLLHLAGWSVALAALWRTLAGAGDPDRRHGLACWLAAALAGLGELLVLAGWSLDRPAWWAAGLELAVWGFLTPLFLTVCHRMIPWFTSRVVANYVMIRPYPPLWALWAGCLIHFGLVAAGRGEWSWLVDWPMAAIAFWFSARWGFARGFQVRLLAMLHLAFLWAGVAFALHGLDSLAAWLDLGWRAGHAPLHAFGIGFFGAMLIGMASRVSLGHSGRKLEADGFTWALFWAIQLVALARMAPDLGAGWFPHALVDLAGWAWLLVFGAWAWKYAPFYWRPREDGKPG